MGVLSKPKLSIDCPISLLPIELLVEIFNHVLPGQDETDDVRLYSQEKRHRPYVYVLFLLTHVCRGWKDIAIATSEFWKTTHLHLKKDTQHLFSLILQRSSQQPFSFYLYQNRSDQFSELLAILYIALPHRSRWNIVRLHLLDDQIASTALLPQMRALKMPFTSLHTFQISFGTVNLEPSIYAWRAELWDLLISESPTLGYISWIGADPRFYSSISSSLPLTKIVNLFLGPLPADDAYDILQHVHQLQSFGAPFLHPPRVPGFFEANIDVYIKAQALRDLYFSYSGSSVPQGSSSWTRALLNRLSAPLLEKLVLWDCCEHTPATVLALVKRSKCSLKAVQLMLYNAQPRVEWEQETIALLQDESMKTAHSFNLHNSTLPMEQLLKALMNEDEQSGSLLLPSMINLDLILAETVIGTDGLLGSMISSRCRPNSLGVRLSKCIVMLQDQLESDRVDSSNLASLLAAGKNGLELSWCGYCRRIRRGRREVNPQLDPEIRMKMDRHDIDAGCWPLE